MDMTRRVFATCCASFLGACSSFARSPAAADGPAAPAGPAFPNLPADPLAVAGGTITPLQKSDAEWKKALDPLAYDVLRHEGTERAFTGRYADHHEAGIYTCAGCGLQLFASNDKFESGTGWPSFTRPIRAAYVKEITDSSYGMIRTEVECARCAGHLGHVFNDGPRPTGLRYCMNSVSLLFVPAKA